MTSVVSEEPVSKSRPTTEISTECPNLGPKACSTRVDRRVTGVGCYSGAARLAMVAFGIGVTLVPNVLLRGILPSVTPRPLQIALGVAALRHL